MTLAKDFWSRNIELQVLLDRAGVEWRQLRMDLRQAGIDVLPEEGERR